MLFLQRLQNNTIIIAVLWQEGAEPMFIPDEAPDSRRLGLNWMVVCLKDEDDPTTWTGRGKLCAFLTSYSRRIKMSGEDRAFFFLTLNRGDDEGLTESHSEDTKETAAISCAEGE